MTPIYTRQANDNIVSTIKIWTLNHEVQGIILSLPISLLCNTCYTLTEIGTIIESLAFTLFNLIGELFQIQECSLEGAMDSFYSAFRSIVILPSCCVSVFLSPIIALNKIINLIFYKNALIKYEEENIKNAINQISSYKSNGYFCTDILNLLEVLTVANRKFVRFIEN